MEDQAASSNSDTSTDTPAFMWLVRALSMLLIFTALTATIMFPGLMHNSDYLSAFYVAGTAVLQGKSSALYPAVNDVSFRTSAFNLLAHHVLPHLSPNMIAIYMYSPANAVLFAPFALLPPVVSMFVWQLVNLAAAVMGILLTWSLGGGRLRKDDAVWCVFLFLPVVHTLLIGQLGLLLGILPLGAALFLLVRRQNEFGAGAVLSSLLLKPQFLPVALLIAGSLALNKRWRCTGGLFGGMLLIVVIASVLLGPNIWLAAVKGIAMSDTFFTDPSYGVPFHLTTCLPGTAMLYVGPDYRHIVKLITYVLAALIGLHALFVSFRLLRHSARPEAIIPVFCIGVFVLPLVVPHLLFYDLCVFAVPALLLRTDAWRSDQKFDLTIVGVLTWIVLNIYYLMAVSPAQKIVQPALLVAFLLLVYARLLTVCGRKATAEPTAA